MGRHRPPILVTRPAGQAEALCRSLRDLGYPTHHQPLLEIEALDELSASARQCLLDLDHYRHVIFVSANAVRHGMDRIADYWSQLPVGLNWYAVGGASAALLQEYGVRVEAPGQAMNSEGLLALAPLRAVAGQGVLIVRGQGGRTLLREELSRRGARVGELACYRRRRPQLAPGELAALLQQSAIQLILVSSGEGLHNLRTLLSPQETTKFSHISLVVPSQRVALQAREAGFDRVITADNASDPAMLKAIGEWKENNE